MVFRGVESGQIEAVFKAASLEALARPYRSGLEGSAVGGALLHISSSPPDSTQGDFIWNPTASVLDSPHQFAGL